MIKKLYILTFLLAFGFSECIGDCQNGYGTFTWATGTKYVGELKDGKYDGWGILTRPDGTSQIGIWFNDNFVEEKTFTEVIKYLKAKYPESDLFKDF